MDLAVVDPRKGTRGTLRDPAFPGEPPQISTPGDVVGHHGCDNASQSGRGHAAATVCQASPVARFGIP
jgi:hypothetical protein